MEITLGSAIEKDTSKSRDGSFRGKAGNLQQQKKVKKFGKGISRRPTVG